MGIAKLINKRPPIHEEQQNVLADQGSERDHHESRKLLPVSVRKTVSRLARSLAT